MPSELWLKLRDGAKATVTIGVQVVDGDTSGDPRGRARDLECLLAGALGAVVGDTISAQAVGWKSPEPTPVTVSEAPPKAKPDSRIGLMAKPKYRNHEMYGQRGRIVGVHPSGHGGLHDPGGVLHIQTEGGYSFLAKADDWVTA